MDRIPRLSDKEHLILELLIAHRSRSGSELVEDSGGQLVRGTVYPTLIRMKDKGYVTSQEGETPPWGGPPRRYYEATGFGRKVFEAHRALGALGRLRLVPAIGGIL